MGNSAPRNRLERLQPEAIKGQYFFQDLLNRQVAFVDDSEMSDDFLKLNYDSSRTFAAGRNLISIRGNFETMEVNTEILIEAIDSNGDVVKTQVFDLNDDAHNRVISVEITDTTPPGEVIVTIIASAMYMPDGTQIPGPWEGIPNFRWAQRFVAIPSAINNSTIIFNDESKPAVSIKEIKKPYYELTFNQELDPGAPLIPTGFANTTSSYILSTSVNTGATLRYRKTADRYLMTAVPLAPANTLDFGGFSKDMEGGIIIVRDPQNPYPLSIHGGSVLPVFADAEQGDGLFENGDFQRGAFLTTVLEFLSPWEIRVSSPHTTWQGSTAIDYQEFEHERFDPSDFELIWSQLPTSFSIDPVDPSTGAPFMTSYAHVTFDNLEPLTGDVSRIKCYLRSAQTPYDWVLASDNAVEPQELLYRKDHEKHRTQLGDFSQWGVAQNDMTSIAQYWEVDAVATGVPSFQYYKQLTAGLNPPIDNAVLVGTQIEGQQLDGTAFWWLRAKESASFVENQWYELSFKALSEKVTKTGGPSSTTIEAPRMSAYMSGSAFVDGGDEWGKVVGVLEDTSPVKKKWVEIDPLDDNKEKGYTFAFKADGTDYGLPQFKIDSGIWYFWDISIKPRAKKGYTPATWDVIFPTIRANVLHYDSLDFRFEFYNDAGMIANYTAEIEGLPWENEYTLVATNIVAGGITVPQPGCINATCITGSGLTMNGTLSVTPGVVTVGTLPCPTGDSLVINADITASCLTQQEFNIVTWDPTEKTLHYSIANSATVNTQSLLAGGCEHGFSSMSADTGTPTNIVSASGCGDAMFINGEDGITTNIVNNKLRIIGSKSFGDIITYTGATPGGTATPTLATQSVTYVGTGGIAITAANNTVTFDGAAGNSIWGSAATRAIITGKTKIVPRNTGGSTPFPGASSRWIQPKLNSPFEVETPPWNEFWNYTSTSNTGPEHDADIQPSLATNDYAQQLGYTVPYNCFLSGWTWKFINFDTINAVVNTTYNEFVSGAIFYAKEPQVGSNNYSSLVSAYPLMTQSNGCGHTLIAGSGEAFYAHQPYIYSANESIYLPQGSLIIPSFRNTLRHDHGGNYGFEWAITLTT